MCSISGERPLDGVNSCHITSIMDQWNGSQRVFVVKIFRKNGGRFTKQQFGLFCTRRVPTSYQRREFAVRSFISDSSSVSFSRTNPVSKVFWTLDLLPVSKGPNREIWTPSILQSTRAPHNLPPFLVKCFYDTSLFNWSILNMAMMIVKLFPGELPTKHGCQYTFKISRFLAIISYKTNSLSITNQTTSR